MGRAQSMGLPTFKGSSILFRNKLFPSLSYLAVGGWKSENWWKIQFKAGTRKIPNNFRSFFAATINNNKHTADRERVNGHI